jgi:hypothetical protein
VPNEGSAQFIYDEHVFVIYQQREATTKKLALDS